MTIGTVLAFPVTSTLAWVVGTAGILFSAVSDAMRVAALLLWLVAGSFVILTIRMVYQLRKPRD
jgi:hypothetical protein